MYVLGCKFFQSLETYNIGKFSLPHLMHDEIKLKKASMKCCWQWAHQLQKICDWWKHNKLSLNMFLFFFVYWVLLSHDLNAEVDARSKQLLMQSHSAHSCYLNKSSHTSFLTRNKKAKAQGPGPLPLILGKRKKNCRRVGQGKQQKTGLPPLA